MKSVVKIPFEENNEGKMFPFWSVVYCTDSND